MKINEVVINEGAMWDKFKGAAASAGSWAANAARATGDTLSAVSLPARNIAAKAGYAITGKEGAGKSLAIQSQFIKNFANIIRTNLTASRTSGVAPNINAIVNSLAKSEHWDLVNSPYKNDITTAINAVNSTNFSSSSVQKLGALLYQVATTSDSGMNTATGNTQSNAHVPLSQKMAARGNIR